MNGNDPWAGILDGDETILWQGRPDASVTFGAAALFQILFGMAFAGFALFWMVMASLGGGYFWAFGLIHFTVGVGIMVAGPLWGPWRRRHTWYTLTNKRGFIATDMPLAGRKLRSYPIDARTVLGFEEGAFSDIHFAKETRRTKNGVRSYPIGFERIADGRAVYALMRDIQKGTAWANSEG